MTLAGIPIQQPSETRGEVRLVDALSRARLQRSWEASGWLVVSVGALGAGARGQLGEWIGEAIETALEQHNACPSSLEASAEPDLVLSDQLYRARQQGLRGIVLDLDTVAGLVGTAGSLSNEDSRALRMLAATCRRRAFCLWLAANDAGLLAYGPPLPLKAVLGIEDPPGQVLRLDLAQPRIGSPSSPEPSPAPSKTSAPAAKRPAKSPAEIEALSQRWPALMRALDEAQGPKPLAVIERLFVEKYVPLAEAVTLQKADERALVSLERFRKSFEKSYTEAFAALKVTRKRPQMVLDVPQIASRLARLHGARSVALVLVDGMRFDIGLRVAQLLQEQLTGHAVLADQTTLWAALPTTTPVQIQLLARGAQGLTEPLDDPELREQEMLIPRGKNASLMRRLRIGGRELHKLDVIHANLADPGPSEAERIEDLAQGVTAPLARFALGLQPRTLLYVFGDHGFLLPDAELGTGPGLDGGAHPEQVLVPGQAWLIGGVH